MNSEFTKKIAKVGIYSVFVFLLPYFFQLIWNWIMPEVCGFQTLTYWQAWFIGFGLRCINGTNKIKEDLDEIKKNL